MPMAEPSSRETSFTAEATPCLARGNELTMAVVAGVDASDTPTPNTPRPTRNDQ